MGPGLDVSLGDDIREIAEILHDRLEKALEPRMLR
jgi:hypothetical protein